MVVVSLVELCWLKLYMRDWQVFVVVVFFI